MWNGIAPECVPSCYSLREIVHGIVTPLSCTLSPQAAFSTCNFACDAGFVLEGRQNVTCHENGLWSEKQPECLIQCPTLKKPSNGLLQCNGSTQDSTCILLCLQTYQLHGARMVTCRSDGIWSEPLGVCLETCPKIDGPKHGFVSPNQCSMIESSVNSTCTFSCEKSYGIFGPITTRCTKDRIWSAEQATCTHEDQYLLILEENEYQVCLTAEAGSHFPEKRDLKQCTGKSYDYWSLKEGSLIKNAGTGLCIGYDQPSEMAKLEFMHCNARDRRQMWMLQTNEVSLKMRYYSYYIWYDYSSAVDVIATNEISPLSRWRLLNHDTMSKSTFYGIVNKGRCPPLKGLPNGLWQPDSCWQHSSIDGTICVFICAPGYGAVNQSTIVMCKFGIWEGSQQPYCYQSCPAFNSTVLSNAKITPEECFTSNFVERGTTCTFSCDDDYFLIFEQNMACLVTGKWSSRIPKCIRYCPPVSAPTNGKTLPTNLCRFPLNMQEVGSICKIDCNEGYVISGSSTTKCLPDGTWNETTAICVRACFKPEPPTKGEVNCHEVLSLYPISTSCNYSCSAGRTLHPDVSSVTCLISGTWNNYPPSCQKFCPFLLPLNDDKIKPFICIDPKSIFPNDFTCSYSCDLNYTLGGEKDLKCLTSGKWSSPPPICKSDFHFLLVHELKNLPLICVIADEFSYYGKHSVTAVPFAHCNRCYPLHVWTINSFNRIQNVSTGWCLSLAALNEGEKVVLSKCESGYHQQWESWLENQFVTIRLYQSDFYLQYHNNYVFISKEYYDLETISWTTRDLSNNYGTFTGMQLEERGSCPRLSLPSGTFIKPQDCKSLVKIGTSCAIKCERGYQLQSGNSSTTLVCGKFGIWNSFDIYCKRQNCPPLPKPPSDTFISKTMCTINSVPAFSNKDCAYSCAKGFYLDLPGGSTGILRCLGNGFWSEPVPKCIQYCKPLKISKNVKVTSKTECREEESAISGQVCAFSCKPHFYLKGPEFLQCKSGEWNRTEPVCNEISGKGRCKGFKSVNNAKLAPFICYSNNVPYRTVCRIGCNDGYSLVPSTYNEVVCQANGKWSLPLPKCKKMCKLMELPTHGHLEPESCRNGVVTEGEKCRIVCEKGFSVSSDEIPCLNTGFPKKRDSCVSKPQFMIQSANECAQATGEGNGWVYFKTCALDDLSQWWEWIDNRRIRNVKTHTCLVPTEIRSYAPGNLVNCRKVRHHGWDCDTNKGLIFESQFYMAKAISFPPNILFVVDPNEDDSQWIPKQTTELQAASVNNLNARACLFRPHSNCPQLPRISNGYLEKRCKKSSKYIPGTICTYYCNDGYLLQGQAKIRCQENNGGAEVQCKIACPLLHVPAFAKVIPKACEQEQLAEATLCTFSCQEGFILTGSSQRFCQPDGSWSGVSTICHQTCPALKIPPMLTISPPTCTLPNQAIGTVCTASCPFGYSLVGNLYNVCMKVANGKILPTDCTKPGKYNGAVCVVECDENYGIQGSVYRTCTQDGLWSGSQAKCSRECKALSAPYNGVVKCDRKQPLVGDYCRFSCNPNYAIAGSSNTRVCLENGQWSGEIITCEREDQFKIVQGAPNNQEVCLTVTEENVVTVAKNDFCKFANNSIRWAWHNENLIRHSNTRLCLAGNVLTTGSYLTLKTCDEKDPDQIWECSAPKIRWFIHLARHHLYPLHSPISRQYVLLFTEEGLNFVLNGSFAVNRHTQWYATTPSAARVSICSIRQLDSCEPLEVSSPTIVEPIPCYSQHMPIGSICYISCPPDYTLNRHITATECKLGGRWSHAIPKCIPSCNSFSISNLGALTVNPPACSGNYRHPENFVCRFSCPPNMQLVGNPILTCQKNSK